MASAQLSQHLAKHVVRRESRSHPVEARGEGVPKLDFVPTAASAGLSPLLLLSVALSSAGWTLWGKSKAAIDPFSNSSACAGGSRRESVGTTTSASTEIDQDELVGTVRIENRFLREHVRSLNRDPKEAEKEDESVDREAGPPRWADETYEDRQTK